MLTVAVIWGINFSVTKGAFARFPPLAFTGVRFAIASLLLVPLVRQLEGTARCRRAALPRLIVLGVVGNTVYQLVLHPGLARTTASNSALILASMPLDRGAGRRRPRVSSRCGPGCWPGCCWRRSGWCWWSRRAGGLRARSSLAGDLLSLAAVSAGRATPWGSGCRTESPPSGSRR